MSRDVFQDVILVFAWRDWGKPRIPYWG